MPCVSSRLKAEMQRAPPCGLPAKAQNALLRALAGVLATGLKCTLTRARFGSALTAEVALTPSELNADNQDVLAGAIQPLVRLIDDRSATPISVKEAATMALSVLGWKKERNVNQIAAAGGIPVVTSLMTSSSAQVQGAAMTLFRMIISTSKEVRVAAAADAISPLMSLLLSPGSDEEMRRQIVITLTGLSADVDASKGDGRGSYPTHDRTALLPIA